MGLHSSMKSAVGCSHKHWPICGATNGAGVPFLTAGTLPHEVLYYLRAVPPYTMWMRLLPG